MHDISAYATGEMLGSYLLVLLASSTVPVASSVKGTGYYETGLYTKTKSSALLLSHCHLRHANTKTVTSRITYDLAGNLATYTYTQAKAQR